jgi:hypothetical protein
MRGAGQPLCEEVRGRIGGGPAAPCHIAQAPCPRAVTFFGGCQAAGQWPVLSLLPRAWMVPNLPR